LKQKKKNNKFQEIIKIFWNNLLFGKVDENTIIQQRMYKILSLSFSLFLLLLSIAFLFNKNYFYGISFIVIGFLGFGFLYYFSRFEDKYKPWYFTILLFIIIAIIWAQAKGLNSNIQIIIFPSIIALISIFDKKNYGLAIGILIILIVGLYVVEIYKPELFYLIGEEEDHKIEPIIVLIFTVYISIFVVHTIIDNHSLKIEQLKKQKKDIDTVYSDILSSINYAYNIQHAVLPRKEHISELLTDYFVFYKPRNIVSGDFYWINKHNDKTFVIAADCTGHGVPGAFMSMLGISLLNETILRKGIVAPNIILAELRKSIKTLLPNLNDGMDMGICAISEDKKTLEYSGANIPLYLIRDDKLNEIKGSRQPISNYPVEKDFEYNLIELQKGDLLYMASDGFKDQIGGPNKSKFLSKNFKLKLLEIHSESLKKQKEILSDIFSTWIEEQKKNTMFSDFSVSEYLPNFNNEIIQLRKEELEKRLQIIKERALTSRTYEIINSQIEEHQQEYSSKVQQLDDVLVIGFRI